MKPNALIVGLAALLGIARVSEANGPANTLVVAQAREELPAPAAQPTPLFEPSLRPAGRAALLTDDGVYRKVRLRHRSRHYALALTASEEAESALFPDRVSLLRGRAYESLGLHDRAQAAYLEAIDQSQSPALTEDAVRGLISVAGKRRDRKTELAYLDALIAHLGDAAEPWLLNRRVEVLSLVDPARAREEAWKIVDAWPNAAAARQALKSLKALERRVDPVRPALAEVKALLRTGKTARAAAVLKKAKAATRDPRRDLELDLALVDVLRERGARTQAEVLLARLERRVGVGPGRAGVLLQGARVAVDRHQWSRARERFFSVIDEYPESDEAKLAAREWVQLEYDARDYAAAAERGLKLLALEGERIPAESLWLSAWSAHLAGSSTLAESLFTKLIERNASPDLLEAATYWRGRTLERLGRAIDSRAEYRRLAASDPLGYYGLLAQSRLETHGDPFALAVPAAQAVPMKVDEVIARLGPNRPIGVDRAVALFRANLVPEGVEELNTVLEFYRAQSDGLGVALSIELFRLFDRDAWLFLQARYVAERDGDLLDEAPDIWRVWNHAYPRPFDRAVGRASRDHGVDPNLVYAVMRTESLFRPYAVSPVGARGLMQLMPRTARWLARTTPAGRSHGKKFRLPDSNVWLGAGYVRNMLERYDGNMVFALGAYNAGPATMDRWRREFAALAPDEFVERTPYLETRRYIRRALESYFVYRRLYGSSGPLALVSNVGRSRKGG